MYRPALPIVVASEDYVWRSALAAMLGMDGETVVTARDYRRASLSDGLRAHSVLVVDADQLRCAPEARRELLQEHGWQGRIILISANHEPALGDAQSEDVAIIPRSGGTQAIRHQIREWLSVPDQD
ncbi:hypothetical protein [Stakelama marina]|uniref:Uncharacterized protein n=1 Tax=Stakelama marina TaxID=2826939 RepID=A0A8T4I8Y7_9SPHN|nr:hypothetical protein [Stakelama marina]MBR0550970.1 hypothetical protein [Stakelama marina]